MLKLKTIFKENWKSILFSYFLFSMQSIFMLIYPKVLGESIDHLIAKDYSFIFYLLLTFFGMMVFNYISRVYDTIVFSKIYRRFASIETSNQFDNNVETTKINGRLTLMSSVVRFFETDMILILNAAFGLLGSIYFISLVDFTLVPYLIFSAILTLIVSYYFSPKIAAITKDSNDISEEQTEIINHRKISLVNNLLKRKQLLSIKLSNLDAKFIFLIQFIAYGTVTALLTYYVVFNTVSVGSVFSTYRYLFDFVASVSILPYIIISFINIKDVIKRLETEN
jgi:ABC-type multidrug transport system fused ATPase/permease subunit